MQGFAYGALTLCSQPFQALGYPALLSLPDRAAARSRPSCNPDRIGPQAIAPIGLGWSLFARHYSGSRDFFPFLRLLRCVSSPACPHLPYVFRQG